MNHISRQKFILIINNLKMCSSVLGSYAHFLWEVEDDEEEELGRCSAMGQVISNAAMVEAF